MDADDKMAVQQLLELAKERERKQAEEILKITAPRKRFKVAVKTEPVDNDAIVIDISDDESLPIISTTTVKQEPHVPVPPLDPVPPFVSVPPFVPVPPLDPVPPLVSVPPFAPVPPLDPVSTPLPPPIKIPNNAENESKFRWHSNGKAKLVRPPNSSYNTQENEVRYPKSYFKCASPNCEAKKEIHDLPGSNLISYRNTHNHHPPNKTAMDSETKATLKGQLKVGAKPNLIYRDMVNNSKKVVKRSTMYSMKHRMVAATLPTKDVFTNLTTTHSPRFLCKLQLDPGITIILASDNGLGVLGSSKFTMTDGTFNLVENELIFTTLHGHHNNVPVPAAYLLSDLRTTKTYYRFFKKIKTLVLAFTGSPMEPAGCAMDFEDALGKAWLEVFPKSSILRDFFHWMQANGRRLKQLGLKAYRKDIKVGLRRMWYADEKAEFDLRQDEFLDKWRVLAPTFVDYYERVWVKHYPSIEWASYARPKDAPSGSGPCEGFHSKVQNHSGLDSTPMRADKFVNELWERDSLCANEMKDEELWLEVKRLYQSGVNKGLRKKANSLPSDIVGSRTKTHHTMTNAPAALATSTAPAYQPTSPKTTETIVPCTSRMPSDMEEDPLYAQFFENNDDEDTEEHIRSLLPPPLPPILAHQPTAPSAIINATNLKLPPRNREKVLCKCGSGKPINDACSHGKVCVSCCGKIPTRCKAPYHNKHKDNGGISTKTKGITAGVLPGLIERVNEAISKNQSLYISYDNNNEIVGLNAREILPLRWEKEKYGIMFIATPKYEQSSVKEKMYWVGRVRRVESKPWDPSPDHITHAPALPLTLERWLESLGMSKYLPALQQYGLGTLAMLSVLDEEMLDTLGIALPPHRKQFLKKAKEMS